VDALNPGFHWNRQISAPGHSAVDFEQRVDFRRLHDYRLARARQALAGSQLGSIRLVEKRAYDLFVQNLVKGTSHLALGQEAVAAGFAVAMRPDDYTFCTYRGHHHTLDRAAADKESP
jgi:TPP-dependent pyruvate/acetoin dehydrogenase alpha subunit